MIREIGDGKYDTVLWTIALLGFAPMSGVARFDCYPSDFLNGIIGLAADEIAAYTVIVMMQYDRGCPVRYEGRERELVVRTGLTRSRLDKAVSKLVALGKISSCPDGLFNARTTAELDKIRERIEKNRENSVAGGNSTRLKFEKIRNENKGDVGPTGLPNGRPKDGPIFSATSHHYNNPSGSENAPPPETSPLPNETPDARLYRRGKEVLGKSAGGMIRKLIAAKGGSIAQAHAAIETASEKADPSEYIGAIINSRNRPRSADELRIAGEAW